MDMDKVAPKLDTFATMVLKDATHKAGLLLNQARQENQKIMEEQEAAFLWKAYHNIQQALNQIDRENNELYSAKLFEAKQLLFRKRQEIMEGVFQRVQIRLEQYRAGDEYLNRLEAFLLSGMNEVGPGELQVLAECEDIARIDRIKERINRPFALIQSEEPLLGGCVVVNQTTGRIADYSFLTRLKQQREVFLELSGMNINL